MPEKGGEMMNREEFDFLGITKFHEAGYIGKGVTIVSKENIIDRIFDDVICKNPKKNTEAMLKYNSHGTDVMDFIRQVAPRS